MGLRGLVKRMTSDNIWPEYIFVSRDNLNLTRRFYSDELDTPQILI